MSRRVIECAVAAVLAAFVEFETDWERYAEGLLARAEKAEAEKAQLQAQVEELQEEVRVLGNSLAEFRDKLYFQANPRIADLEQQLKQAGEALERIATMCSDFDNHNHAVFTMMDVYDVVCEWRAAIEGNKEGK